MFITSAYKSVHSFRCKFVRGAERVPRILLKRYSLPGANEVVGDDHGKHYLLSTCYNITL